MSTIERMTVTMPAEMAAFVKSVVETGDYASTSEVVREAIRDLKAKRSQQVQQLEALRRDIDKGLADITTGRVKPFDADAIVARGRALLADTRSA
jgi:antitoxin ParD1/3/4